MSLIIANAHLIPPFLPTVILDMILLAIAMIMTVKILYRWTKDLCWKFRLRRKIWKKVMTIWEWIKSRIKSDKYSNYRAYSSNGKHRRKRKGCPRYITPRKKGHPTRVGNKRPDYDHLTISYAAPASSDDSEDPSTLRTSPIPFKADSDSFVIGIDSHCTSCISNNSAHFIGPITPVRGRRIKGFGGEHVAVVGEGTVEWKIEDDDGKTHRIKIKNTQYVPKASLCLLSPQHWAQQANDHYPKPDGTWCADKSKHCILYWNQEKYKRTIPWDPNTNTARIRSAPGSNSYRIFVAACEELHDNESREHVCWDANIVSDDENDEDENDNANQVDSPPLFRPINREATQKADTTKEENLTDFLTEEEVPKMTHVIHDDQETLSATDDLAELLRWHYRLGHLSFKRIRLLAALGILPRRLLRVKTPKCAGCLYGAMTKRPWRTKAASNRGKLRQAKAPGDCISVDQLESSTPGFIAQLKGSPTKHRYKAATVFVDHFSNLGYVYLQRNLSSNETILAKQAFEAYAASLGVRVKHYHADNGRFADNAFIESVRTSGQTISYCAVNAHWQNGKAEKRIRDLQEAARKQLLHAKARWPSAVETCLWPYPLRSANHTFNCLPDRDDASCALERFSGAQVAPKLKENHTFGCPVYALQNKLQAGKSQPKWHPRARLGLNLGPSPRHAGSVSLVLNLDTAMVSPQYHVQHDDFFETVRPTAGHEPTFSRWQSLAGFKRESRPQPAAARGGRTPAVPEPEPSIPVHTTMDPQDEPDFAPPSSEPAEEEIAIKGNEGATEDETTSNVPQPTRRSARTRRLTEKARLSKEQETFNWRGAYSATFYEAMHQDDYREQDAMSDPIAYLAKSDPDTMYFDQAIRQPDRKEFINSIVREVNSHCDKKHWQLIPREQVPEGEPILDSVWSMKRKRDIKTRKVYKWKSRLNVHGRQQERGVNYDETYSPVVTWFSIRTLLVLAALNRWCTRQVDFVLAYPQAPIEYDLYMELPKGVETKYGNGKTHVLKLIKNLYGQKQAGRVWNLYLTEKLLSIGFKQSAVDECVFYRGQTIFIFYVDDGIFAGPDAAQIDQAIKDVEKAGLDIEDKGDLNDYLGVNIEYLDDGKVKLSQPHLIRQIVADVLPDFRGATRTTPALSTKILRRDQAAPKFDGRFHYRSAIGKLNFLEKSTRPDIAYAVHQCARFCEDPRASHGAAVESVAKYLAATIDDGIILDPKRSRSFEVFADADFCGNWYRPTAAQDPSTAKSRTGYAIMYAGCPIIWASKLQTQVALSTTEAEYLALSQALRDVIPVMHLIKELAQQDFKTLSTKPRVYCKAFEDNSGALELARTPKLRPRTKHINIVYHHFRSYVREGSIQLHSISTRDQIGDIFTKPLSKDIFTRHRKKLLGW